MPILATVRGMSSAEFPKKGYNIKLRDEQDRPHAQPLLDLPAHEKWALVAPWSFDLSYINNAFVYALSNRIGRWAPRTRFAEVFLNADGGDLDQADYAGIYVITDRVERGPARVDIAEPSGSDPAAPAITGGYILKIDHNEAGEPGWATDHPISADGVSSVILVSPGDDVTPAHYDYIRGYVQRMEAALQADRASGWTQRTSLAFIDRASWVDHHLLNTFVCNPDAFVRSAYFSKDRGGKLVAGPVWDFDRALGSYWDARSSKWDVWCGVGGTDVWRTGWWGIIAQDPEFIQDWIDRWQSLRRSEFSNDALISHLDTLSGAIGSAAAARDATRWPDNVTPRGSYAAQIEHVKHWVTQRARWIDEQFVPAPSVTAGVSLTFTAPAGSQLAYTLNGSDPRSVGGGLSPTARIVSEPLIVPATANVHVRVPRRSPDRFSRQSVEFGDRRGSLLAPVTQGSARQPLESCVGRHGRERLDRWRVHRRHDGQALLVPRHRTGPGTIWDGWRHFGHPTQHP
jgi:hypothetical protein